ncbi:hypothetical protein D3C81_2027540 [compost metagenome]
MGIDLGLQKFDFRLLDQQVLFVYFLDEIIDFVGHVVEGGAQLIEVRIPVGGHPCVVIALLYLMDTPQQITDHPGKAEG